MAPSLVSIVIPTFKRPQSLKRAIHSVLGQTYKRWELIVVDDNDAESLFSRETIAAIENLSRNNTNCTIKLIKHGRNRGGSAARNTGIKHSTGRYIAFLDDDDIWLKEKIMKQVEIMETNRGIGFVYCQCLEYDMIKRRLKQKTTNHMKGFIFNDLLKKRCGINTSTVLVQKELALQAGGFDESLPGYQDYDFLLKLSMAAACDYSEDAMVIYLVGKDSITNNPKLQLEGLEKIVEKYRHYYLERNLKASLSLHYTTLGGFAVRSGCRKSSLSYYRISLKTNPLNIKTCLLSLIVLMGGARLFNLARFTFKYLSMCWNSSKIMLVKEKHIPGRDIQSLICSCEWIHQR